MPRLRDLTERLEALTAVTPGIEAAALVSEEGLVLASALPHDVEPAVAARVGAQLATLGTSAARDLARGEPEEVIVRSALGWSLVAHGSGGIRLLVLAARHASIAILLLEGRKAADELAALASAEDTEAKEARHGDAVG